MNLTRSKVSSKPARRKQSTPEKEFEKAWNQVIDQQKKNARLREEVQSFSRSVSAAIQEQEKAYILAQCQTCEHLLSFCSRKSLSLRQRGELLDWIMDYLISIGSNPFSTQVDLTELRNRVDEQLAEIYPDEPALFNTGSEHGEKSDDAQQPPQTEDLFNDLFAEFEMEDDMDKDALNPFAEAFFEEFAQQQRATEEARQAEGQALKEMMKTSSINRLFRKVARVLHPDRERDEGAREEKNRLMGALLHARQTNDIPMIFSLYAEHVGESPLQELAGDLKGVTQLLQRQYAHLREQKHGIIEEEPFAAAMYRRFYQKSDQAVQRALRKYVIELEDRTLNLQHLREDVTTLSKLKWYLARL